MEILRANTMQLFAENIDFVMNIYFENIKSSYWSQNSSYFEFILYNSLICSEIDENDNFNISRLVI